MNVADRLTGGPDPSEVRAELEALREPERRKRAKEAEREFDKIAWKGGLARPSKRWRATAVAWAGTTTARKLASDFWRFGYELEGNPDLADDVYAVVAARGAHFFETLARGLFRNGPNLGWSFVRRAVREGLIPRPDDPAYVEGMVFGVQKLAGHPQLDGAYNGLLADPSLLEHELWLLFEVDVAATLGRATTWGESGEERFPGFPKYERGENLWIYALTRLADEGRVDRQRLLDASLDALLRDFRASSVGWYASLHEALEPTQEERNARLDRYLALLTSSAPAVVKEGLAALKALGDVPAEGLARVTPTVFAHRQKNLALDALRLLEATAKRDEASRPLVLAAAAQALAHERADVQERALKLLEKHGGDAPRAELLAYVDAVSPALRDRVAALTGVAAETPRVETVNRFPGPRMPEPTPGPPLEPVRGVDELIELTAALLEGHGDGDDAERFLDGVARLCDERPPRFKERTEGLRTQAGEHEHWRPALSSGRDLVATVVRAWTRGERAKATSPKGTLGGLLAHRALEVAERAARGRPRALLAFPIHAGGWVDPAALDARGETTGGIFRRDTPDHFDKLGARLRAVPHAALELRPEVFKTGELTRAKFEWGPLPPELADVGEIPISLQKLGRDASTWWNDDPVWLADDSLGARWLLTIVPAVPEIQFARALSAIVDFVDGSVYRNPEVVLEQMLAPSVPLRDPAWDAVAAALLAKSPDLQRLAVDVLVATVEDERYDAAKLGTGLARLLDKGVGSATRLAQPLRDAGRVSPLHGAQLVRAVGELAAQLSTKPHGIHAPLEAAAELSAACGYRVDGVGRAGLERLAATVSPSAKLAKLARSLIG